MEPDLVQIHHASYRQDIPFWLSVARNRDPVLEVGCAHGRVALPLLEAGSRVVGVDRDPAALDYLREALQDLSPEVRDRLVIAEADILDYRSQEGFGAVIIPCNTLSTFSPGSRIALCQKVHSLLLEGGVLAASMPNPLEMFDQLAELAGESDLGESEWEATFIHPETGYPIEVSSRITPVIGEPGALRWEWIYDQLSPDGAVKRDTVSAVHFPALPEKLLAELAEAGFHSVDFMGDFDGSEYQEDSPYLIITAVR